MVEEVKKIDWDKYLDAKLGVTVLVVLVAFGASYLDIMSQSLGTVLAVAIGSFNWFSSK